LTIVYNQGNEFWIEQHTVTITLIDAAGIQSTGVTNVNRPGNCVGYSVTPGFPSNNDNTQAVSLISMLDQGSGTLGVGEFITGFVVRVVKQIGTAGNTNVAINVTLLMRGRGPIST